MHISYQLLEKSRLSMNELTAGTNFNVFYLLQLSELKMKLKLIDTDFAVCFFCVLF